MEVTIVHFLVFDKPHTSVFYDKSLEEIHTDLAQLWSTYHPVRIIHCTDARTVDNQVLLKFQTTNAMKHKFLALHTLFLYDKTVATGIVLYVAVESAPGEFQVYAKKWHNHFYPSEYIMSMTVETGHRIDSGLAEKLFAMQLDSYTFQETTPAE